MDLIINWTKPQIITWTKQNNIKVPSGLNKDDLLRYINGVMLTGPPRGPLPKLLNYSRLVPKYLPTNCDWRKHLIEYGWSVVKINNWNDQFINDYFSWLESCCSNFNRWDINTWTDNNLPPRLFGVIKHWLGHTHWQWKIRELCLPIFEHIWQTKELLCSFDGGCFLPSIGNSITFKNWFHVDQPRDVDNFCSVQGIVNFVSNGANDGGLVLLENSHLVFSKYMNDHQAEGIVWGKTDITDPYLSDKQMIKICAQAGEIILFDSRIFHQNVPPTGTNYRMCTYVSMQPRIGASSEQLRKRIEWHSKGRLTSHWCYGAYASVNSENPNTYGKSINKPPSMEIATLNGIQSKLVGF